jgi:non-homologous end joining protein Ku
LPEPEAEDDEGEVVDLMAALRESVEQTRKKPRKRTRKKPARKAS